MSPILTRPFDVSTSSERSSGDDSTSVSRKHLRNTLWRLRHLLQSVGVPPDEYLLIGDGSISFSQSGCYSLDVEVFETVILHYQHLSGRELTPDIALQLEQAVDLYTGDLLAGVYEDWCLVERERLRLLLLRVLKRLQRHSRLSGAFEAAISYSHRLLALDPLQEDVHRELMRCYVASGQRPLALEQFQLCRRTLRRELEIEPMPETWHLYRGIRNGRGTGPLPATGEDISTSMASVLNQFRQALDALESTWQALQAATAEYGEAKGRARADRP